MTVLIMYTDKAGRVLMCCMEGTYTSSYVRGRTTFLSLHKSVFFTYTVRGIRYTDFSSFFFKGRYTDSYIHGAILGQAPV